MIARTEPRFGQTPEQWKKSITKSFTHFSTGTVGLLLAGDINIYWATWKTQNITPALHCPWQRACNVHCTVPSTGALPNKNISFHCLFFSAYNLTLLGRGVERCRIKEGLSSLRVTLLRLPSALCGDITGDDCKFASRKWPRHLDTGLATAMPCVCPCYS